MFTKNEQGILLCRKFWLLLINLPQSRITNWTMPSLAASCNSADTASVPACTRAHVLTMNWNRGWISALKRKEHLKQVFLWKRIESSSKQWTCTPLNIPHQCQYPKAYRGLQWHLSSVSEQARCIGHDRDVFGSRPKTQYLRVFITLQQILTTFVNLSRPRNTGSPHVPYFVKKFSGGWNGMWRKKPT